MDHITKLIAGMDTAVKPGTLTAVWQKAHWVPDAADTADVVLATEDWSTLLPPGDRGA